MFLPLVHCLAALIIRAILPRREVNIWLEDNGCLVGHPRHSSPLRDVAIPEPISPEVTRWPGCREPGAAGGLCSVLYKVRGPAARVRTRPGAGLGLSNHKMGIPSSTGGLQHDI